MTNDNDRANEPPRSTRTCQITRNARLLKQPEILTEVRAQKTAFFLSFQGNITINGAQIIVRDIPALNGYIHIVDKVSRFGEQDPALFVSTSQQLHADTNPFLS